MTESTAAVRTLLTRIVRGPSPFYQSRLRDVGIDDVSTADAQILARLPPTTRAALISDQLAHLPHGSRRFADAGHAVRAGVTASGDELLVLTWSADDLARERAAGARVLGRLGIMAGMRVANTLPGALVTPGSLLLGDVIEEIGGLDVPLGAIESDAAAKQAWELIDRVQPEVLVLEQSTAARFIAAAPVAARAWWRGVIWLNRGESVAARTPFPSAVGFDGWQRNWLALAEVTSFVGSSCSAERFHTDDGVIVEAVNDELCVTLLSGDTPIIRYASGWRGSVSGSCACGAAGPTVELA